MIVTLSNYGVLGMTGKTSSVQRLDELFADFLSNGALHCPGSPAYVDASDTAAKCIDVLVG